MLITEVVRNAPAVEEIIIRQNEADSLTVVL